MTTVAELKAAAGAEGHQQSPFFAMLAVVGAWRSISKQSPISVASADRTFATPFNFHLLFPRHLLILPTCSIFYLADT